MIMQPVVKMDWFGNKYTTDQYMAIARELRRVSAMIDFMEEYVSLDSKDISAMLMDIADGADKAADAVVLLMGGAQ